jgi:hypothetical protein
MVGLIGGIGALMLWDHFGLPGSIVWRARRGRVREVERLRRAPIAELLAGTRKAIRHEKWEHLGPAGGLLQDDGWTDDGLLRALRELRRAVLDDDAARGRFGRDSGGFEWHDCGISLICDALEARRATTNTA